MNIQNVMIKGFSRYLFGIHIRHHSLGSALPQSLSLNTNQVGGPIQLPPIYYRAPLDMCGWQRTTFSSWTVTRNSLFCFEGVEPSCRSASKLRTRRCSQRWWLRMSKRSALSGNSWNSSHRALKLLGIPWAKAWTQSQGDCAARHGRRGAAWAAGAAWRQGGCLGFPERTAQQAILHFISTKKRHQST